mgnify:FL=1
MSENILSFRKHCEQLRTRLTACKAHLDDTKRLFECATTAEESAAVKTAANTILVDCREVVEESNKLLAELRSQDPDEMINNSHIMHELAEMSRLNMLSAVCLLSM